jgi:gamma-glutamyltranspeptidase/glutathione hydrolase
MRGIVVAPEPPAAEAGREILAEGGNAADAAVAVALAQGVVNPLLVGIGGMGTMYVVSGPTGERAALDCCAAAGSLPPPARWVDEFAGREETYGRYMTSEDFQIGYPSIMVPGVVRGCGELWRRFGSGRVAWARLVEPAARLAREGFEIYPFVRRSWEDDYPARAVPKLATRWAKFPEAARIYGRAPEVGERFVQPDYAATLRRIAQGGPDEFYTGRLGQTIGDDLERGGSLITRRDLQSYQVLTPPAVRGAYRRFEVEGAAPPASTSQVIGMLQIAAGFDWRALDPAGPDAIELIAKIMRAGFYDHVPLKGDPPYAAAAHRLRELTRPEHAAGWIDRIQSGARVYNEGTSRVDAGTTHVTAADEEGTVVAFTHSIGTPGASGIVTAGHGFLYNHFLGHFNPRPGYEDSIVPGKRGGGGAPIVVYRGGRPYIALGAPGGSRIITACFQTVVNVVEHGLSIQEAVSAPRCHSEERNIIFLEPSHPAATEAELLRRGYDVRRATRMSTVQAVLFDEAGRRHPGADPRGGQGVGVVE